VSGRSMRNASEAMARRNKDAPESVRAGLTEAETITAGEETFHVFGSGNLGLIYVRGEKQRLTRAQINQRFPALLPGLAKHPGVGFVVVLDDDEGPVVLGGDGSLRLNDGHVTGVDPLAPFGGHAAEFVLRVALRPEAPDIYVNSLVDPGTEEVAAFEDLVGCHGGLGGWQDRAFVMVPSDLPFPTELVIGADSLHLALKAILDYLGHGTSAADAGMPTGDE
jgi:hypothetical protein